MSGGHPAAPAGTGRLASFVRAHRETSPRLCSVLLAASAEAGQEWELISITRGPTWEVNQAKGALKQNGKVLIPELHIDWINVKTRDFR